MTPRHEGILGSVTFDSSFHMPRYRSIPNQLRSIILVYCHALLATVKNVNLLVLRYRFTVDKASFTDICADNDINGKYE